MDSHTSLSNLPDDDLVDEAGACRIIGGSTCPIHRSTLWRGIKDGIYPKPRKASAASNRWIVGELRAARDGRAA